MLNVKPGYTFDDVLLVPKHSQVKSRSDIDLSTDLGKGVKLDIPIVSANMKNVTGQDMALAIAKLGGLSILHRFFNYPINDQVVCFYNIFSIDKKFRNNVAVSVGVQDHDYRAVDHFHNEGVKIICVDIAHADSINCHKIVEYIARKFPDMLLIAGNVATKGAARRLVDAGATVIKVGIGPGSLCSTRIETGNGVPQLTALSNIYDEVGGPHSSVKIIADGGIKNAGDCVKALCFSNAVMLGNLLAGTDEAPGETLIIDNNKYKQYAGSSTFKSDHIEGVVGLVPCKGPVKDIINKLLQGIRSGCSYQGAFNLADLRNHPEFIQITGSGLIESHPHDIKLT